MSLILDGSAGVTFPSGSGTQGAQSKVLQVVQATYSTQTQTSTSTFVTTGLTASITPIFSTSKILVIVNQSGLYTSGSNLFNGLQLLRGSTVLAALGGTGSTTAGNLYISTASSSYLDSPATTSSTTYSTQFKSTNNNGAVGVQIGGETSTITLMEIAT